MDERIAALTAQIEKLQAENTFLKCLLDEVGISYVLPASKPTAEISKQLARRFYSYFWGRTDVYSKRSVNKTTGRRDIILSVRICGRMGFVRKSPGRRSNAGIVPTGSGGSWKRSRSWRTCGEKSRMALM